MQVDGFAVPGAEIPIDLHRLGELLGGVISKQNPIPVRMERAEVTARGSGLRVAVIGHPPKQIATPLGALEEQRVMALNPGHARRFCPVRLIGGYPYPLANAIFPGGVLAGLEAQ